MNLNQGVQAKDKMLQIQKIIIVFFKTNEIWIMHLTMK